MSLTKESIKQLRIGTPIVVRRLALRTRGKTERKSPGTKTIYEWWCEWAREKYGSYEMKATLVGWKQGLNGWAYETDTGMAFYPEGPGTFLVRFRREPNSDELLAFPEDCDVDFDWDCSNKLLVQENTEE